MIWGGYREVAMKSIVGPGDVKERQKALHVIDLAESIQKLGDEPAHAMSCKKVRHGWQLVAGRDRFSALALLGIKEAWVHVIAEATPLELLELEIEENLKRRTVDRAALTAEMVRRVAALLPGKPPSNSAGPGRPVTPLGEARAVVAKAEGRTVEAVRRDEQRVAAKVREGGAATAAAAGGTASVSTAPGQERPRSPIETFGRPLPPQMLDVGGLVRQFRAIELTARELSRKAGELSLFGSSDPVAADRIQRAAEELGAMVRGLTPTHLCPYCNGVEGVKCAACHERGWVTRSVFDSAPAERRGIGPDELAAGLDAAPSFGERMHQAAIEAAPAMVAAASPEERHRLARVGLNALIDEATGAQEHRKLDALRKEYAAPKKRKGGVVIVDEMGVEHWVTE